MNKNPEKNAKDIDEKNIKNKGILGKIACFLLALILWGYVSYEKNPDADKTFTNIPVTLAGIEVLEGRNITVLTSDLYASVKLSGTRNILSKVDKNDIKAIVNVSDITTVGEQNPILTISGIPDALNVDDRKIISGTLVTDNLVKKTLEINIELSGKMDDKIVEGGKSVYPSEVIVKGPGTLLENVKAWTEAIDISGVKKSENIFNTEIVLKDNAGSLVSSNMITVSDVSATVTLTCQGKKEVTLEEPQITGSLDGYNISIEKINPEKVVITGPIEAVAVIESLELESIDALYATEKVRCKIILPENIQCETEKAEVKLKFEKFDEAEDLVVDTDETAEIDTVQS